MHCEGFSKTTVTPQCHWNNRSLNLRQQNRFQSLWFHRTNTATLLLNLPQETVSNNFFPWWLKGKKDKRWKQFSSTCSRGYENPVLQNQNRELNLAWHQCYKIGVLGTSGQAEEGAGCLWPGESLQTTTAEKVSVCINSATLPLLCFYSIILQTPDAIQYVIKRQQHA